MLRNFARSSASRHKVLLAMIVVVVVSYLISFTLVMKVFRGVRSVGPPPTVFICASEDISWNYALKMMYFPCIWPLEQAGVLGFLDDPMHGADRGHSLLAYLCDFS